MRGGDEAIFIIYITKYITKLHNNMHCSERSCLVWGPVMEGLRRLTFVLSRYAIIL
jgi:hypothetical protein